MQRTGRWIGLIAALWVAAGWPGGAWAARGDAGALCEAAARRASAASGVPLPVLLAVALSESGRKTGGRFAPWPWVLNVEGAGAFFDTRDAALAAAQQAIASGRDSTDLGCFQVNFRWHGDAFASLSEMIDPDRNAAYAARFLRELYAESGDWITAVGHYHSRTPAHANRYRGVFRRHLAALGAGPLPAPGPMPDMPPLVARAEAPVRENRFQLLQGGGAPVSMGSLVPDGPGLGGLLADRPARSLWGG
ncbi:MULTISPECIES: transglycosylase SLT domain-containing protein [Meridianimarinicoccus]|uniref:transglycosylase SLT domain-containing protein n=1 Tax=Meridianimarinicoccus zhengii TaxID=2056810 RepID=UPI0013A6EA97|nr:transglycosylase SLT domain-containing protein [Phycocomes zhengii]